MFQTEEEAYAAYKSRKVKLDDMSDDDVSLAANGALMAKGNQLSEAPQDTRYMSQADAEDLIASADPDAVSKQDIVDEDDLWVYLEAGEAFGEARLKPEPQVEYDCEHCNDTGKDPSGGPCEVCGDWDEIVSTRREKAETELRAAIEEYAKNYSNWAGETGWSGDLDAVGDEEMYAPDRVASDAAGGFFAEHSDWREWTKVLEISRTELQSWVADEVYEAMVNSAKR